MNYPNMQSELLEAVHGYFEDNPDVETDVLVYLAGLRFNLSRTNELGNAVEEMLIEHGRCPYCGSEVAYRDYKEYHPELDDCPYEIMTEAYCPDCGQWKEND